MIYFDNAATTYPKPQCVYDGVNLAFKEYSFNAGRGSYKQAKNTFNMIEDTRNKISKLVLSSADKVIFTSSATESLNNIIYGLNLNEGDYVYVSPFEHNAIIRTLHNTKANIIVIPFDSKTWNVDINALNDLFVLKKPKAVFISQISNVTGFELPYSTIFKLSKEYFAINVLDSAQAFGIYNPIPQNIDFIVFAGHKSLYSMFGIAGYINLTAYPLSIYKVGGTGSDSLNTNMPSDFPSKYEAGSLNSIGIYSINCALDFLNKTNYGRIEEELGIYFINKMKNIDKFILYLPKDYIPKGIVSFNIKGYAADEIGMILSEDYDICVRTGYHCAPLIHDFICSKPFNGTVRVSFGIFNTKEEIDELVEALKSL